MPFTFRKSKKFGPFRLTAGKRGLSVSGGVGRVRASTSTTGRRSLSVRILRGLGWRKQKG